jgi:hypothetical protein
MKKLSMSGSGSGGGERPGKARRGAGKSRKPGLAKYVAMLEQLPYSSEAGARLIASMEE